MKREIVIVTAAYGNSVVKARGGQAELLSVIADAKADGVEIRRELFTAGELDSLPALAEKIKSHGLFAVYSVPFPLFSAVASLILMHHNILKRRAFSMPAPLSFLSANLCQARI